LGAERSFESFPSSPTFWMLPKLRYSRRAKDVQAIRQLTSILDRFGSIGSVHIIGSEIMISQNCKTSEYLSNMIFDCFSSLSRRGILIISVAQ
jgi:hypothetical protein